MDASYVRHTSHTIQATQAAHRKPAHLARLHPPRAALQKHSAEPQNPKPFVRLVAGLIVDDTGTSVQVTRWNLAQMVVPYTYSTRFAAADQKSAPKASTNIKAHY